MDQLLLDYAMAAPKVQNPDASRPTTFTGVTAITGPGATAIGTYQAALGLGAKGKASIDLAGLALDKARFCVRLVFRAPDPLPARQVLLSSAALPFRLALEPRAAGELDVVADVHTKAHGRRGPDTRFRAPYKPGTWYVADLAYDGDTAALFLDGVCVGVQAFPDGTVSSAGGATRLYVGTETDGTSDHFTGGAIAALQVHAGLPADLEAALGEQRTRAQWFITYKRELLRSRVDLGERTEALRYDLATRSYIQRYEAGAILCDESFGAAFELHGVIGALYLSTPQLRKDLGALVSDEGPTARPGGRKSLFRKGGIYWSPGTGAVAVLGQICLDYENLSESELIGFPVKAEHGITGGLEQEFTAGRMYQKAGAAQAFEVHGAILAHFLATGGVAKWGYPVSDEADFRLAGKDARASRFESARFFWSAKTGAHEMHGDLLSKYEDVKSPAKLLGLPTSDEMDIPQVAGPARCNTFERGALLWYGSTASIVAAPAFKVTVGRIDTVEDEGFGQKQNDIYCHVSLRDGATPMFTSRFPASGDFGDSNILELDKEIPVVTIPTDLSKVVTLTVDVWDADDSSPDDHLGTWTKVLSAANAWGFRENNGRLDSGSFDEINSITAAVNPDVDPKSLLEAEKWWSVKNDVTPELSYHQFATAFADADTEPEWWDGTDWLDKVFYEAVVHHLCEGGNCFGMSLAAIHSRKGASLYSLPIDRFAWGDVVDEFNVQHQHQVGARAIDWFLAQVMTGATHDPVGTFHATQAAFERGDHPILCLTQHYNFSGKGHAILPVAWNDTGSPWTITVHDPNYPDLPQKVEIDLGAHTFAYRPENAKKEPGDLYFGDNWTGGRLYHFPYSIAGPRPRLPMWDAMSLFRDGTIVILGGDAETKGITDLDGRDLAASGARATQRLRQGGTLDGFFVDVKGTHAGTAVRETEGAKRRHPKGAIAGELLVRMGREKPAREPRIDFSDAKHLTVEQILGDRRVRDSHKDLRLRHALRRALGSRPIRRVLADPVALRALPDTIHDLLATVAAASGPRDFIHSVRGVRHGQLDHVIKHGLGELRLQSHLDTSEQAEIHASAIGTSASAVRLSAERDKEVRVVLTNKLGVRRDHLRMTVDGLRVPAAGVLEVSAKPGLGGLEIVGQVPGVDATVTVDGRLGNRSFSSDFTVTVEPGMSLKPSTVIADNALGVATIQQLFGPASTGGFVLGS